MSDIRTHRDDGNNKIDFFEDSEANDGERNRAEPRKSDLTVRRWRHLLPDSDETVRLIVLAQAGDPRARNQILKNFHRAALLIASQYHGPPFGDRLAAALLGLSVAIGRCNPRRNNGFYAFAEPWMRKYVRLEAREWRKRGQAGETRIDRWLYDNVNATVDDVIDKFGIEHWVLCHPGCPVGELVAEYERVRKTAQEAIARRDLYWDGHKPYDTTEGNFDADGNFVGPQVAKVHDLRHWGCYNNLQLSPQLALHGCISRTVDGWTVHADRHAERRLRAIGRRAYASWLVRKYRTAVTPLFARTPMAYVISVNTSRTAVTIADSAKWKSDADKLRATAEVQPTVFDEKDKWGWYRSRKDHHPKNEIETANAASADERTENDSVRHSYPRHQASGVRRADGSRRGDTQSSGRGGRADVARDAAGAAHGSLRLAASSKKPKRLRSVNVTNGVARSLMVT